MSRASEKQQEDEKEMHFRYNYDLGCCYKKREKAEALKTLCLKKNTHTVG